MQGQLAPNNLYLYIKFNRATDYGGPPGKLPPLVKDAHPTVVLAYSFHFRYFSSRQTAIFSNYRFRLIVQGLENRLANYLLRLPLRKQSLRALRCLFPKVNGVSGHSSPFFGLQMPRKWKSSLSERTPTDKRAHTFRAFAEAPSTMRRSREAYWRRASMLAMYIAMLQPAPLKYVRNLQRINRTPVVVARISPDFAAHIYLWWWQDWTATVISFDIMIIEVLRRESLKQCGARHPRDQNCKYSSTIAPSTREPV